MSGMPSLDSSAAIAMRDDGAINQLKSIALNQDKTKTDKEMKEISKNFESMIFRQLLKEMRKTIPNDGYIPRSHATEMYNEMVDDHLAKHLAESSEGGVGSMIYDELKNKNDELEKVKNHTDEKEFISLGQNKTTEEASFIPLKQDLSTESFMKLNRVQNFMQLPDRGHGFVPLNGRERISTDRLDLSGGME